MVVDLDFQSMADYPTTLSLEELFLYHVPPITCQVNIQAAPAAGEVLCLAILASLADDGSGH
jgi:hypothetical protein